MSLINEALKKAQKQRTGDTPSLTEMPAVGGESAARIARRGQPAGFNSLILRLTLGVVALAVVGTGTVLILRRPASAPPPAVPPVATTSAPETSTALAPKPVELAPVPAPVTSPEASVSLVVPATPPIQTSPAATTPATTVVFTPVETPPPVQPAPAQPAAPTVTRKLDPRAINYINSIRVAGIRASANDSKVLMNDRVYRVGDTVEAEMGLKLTGITASSLTFEDENGARFTRNF